MESVCSIARPSVLEAEVTTGVRITYNRQLLSLQALLEVLSSVQTRELQLAGNVIWESYYVVNRWTDKVARVDDRIVCLRSGSAADTQYLADLASYHLRLLKVQSGTPNLVRSAANIFRKYCYSYREELSAGIIVAGVDDVAGAQVYGVPSGGMLYEAPYVIGGLTYNDRFRFSLPILIFWFALQGKHGRWGLYKFRPWRWDFLNSAVTLAVTRDNSSGGVARLSVITDKGVTSLDPVPVVYKNTA